MHADDNIRDEAALWAARTADAAFLDWDGFTAWLERDPAHAAAYDRAMLAAEDAAALLRAEGAAAPAPEPASAPAAEAETSAFAPANDDEDDGTPRRRWAMPALAAALAGLAAVGLWQQGAGGDVYTTAPGQTQLIALEDGGRIELAGGSRLALSDDQREASLEAGRATFTIHHDAANPFVLTAGSDRIVDVGTVFDVRRGAQGLAVEVAEGEVLVNPDSVKIRLTPGRRAERRGGDWQVGTVDAAAVGEWREGRLTFRDASLAEIADQLSRASGQRFVADPASAEVILSGSVLLEAAQRDPASLGPLLGVTITRNGDTWKVAAQ